MVGDWGLGIGDWGLAQSPIPNPQTLYKSYLINFLSFRKISYFIV